jgi:mannose PTS system EIID component
MTRLSGRVVRSAFARSFLIQASWNYHTMLGCGFAYALLPALREIFGDDPDELDASLSRHLELFNAHPYLSTIALGAVLRLEADGSDADTIRRFKVAVRGPLGGLGDSLVWAAWLPAISLASLALYWIGAAPWLVVAFFLVIYNLGHLGLRAWGLSAGLAKGRSVGQSLGQAHVAEWTERMREIATVLLGIVVAAVLAGRGGLADSGALWGGLAGIAFIVGLLMGHRAWRPAAAGIVATILLLSTWGMLT